MPNKSIGKYISIFIGISENKLMITIFMCKHSTCYNVIPTMFIGTLSNPRQNHSHIRLLLSNR